MMDSSIIYLLIKTKVIVPENFVVHNCHPMLLASLSGKPIITPKWSGHLDFLNSQYADFFPGKLTPIPNEAVNDWFVKESQWFTVDNEGAGAVMKRIYNNYGEKLLEKYEKLRQENMEKFSLQAMDKAFHAMLDDHLPKFAMEEEIKLPRLKRISLPGSGQSVQPIQSRLTSSYDAPKDIKSNSGQGSAISAAPERQPAPTAEMEPTIAK